MTAIIIIFIAITTLTAILFFHIGKISERKQWNSLIKNRIIPQPGEKLKALIDNNDLNFSQRKEAIETLKRINPELAKYI